MSLRPWANRSVEAVVWRAVGYEEHGGSAFGRVEEVSDRFVGPSRVVPMGLGERIEASLEANDGDRQIGQAREVAREVCGAYGCTLDTGLWRRSPSTAIDRLSAGDDRPDLSTESGIHRTVHRLKDV